MFGIILLLVGSKGFTRENFIDRKMKVVILECWEFIYNK